MKPGKVTGLLFAVLLLFFWVCQPWRQAGGAILGDTLKTRDQLPLLIVTMNRTLRLLVVAG